MIKFMSLLGTLAVYSSAIRRDNSGDAYLYKFANFFDEAIKHLKAQE